MKKLWTRVAKLTPFIYGFLFLIDSAFADKPKKWQLGFQDAATPVMEKITDLHNLLLVIIGVIGLFVVVAILYIAFRFHEKRNKKPATFSHNTTIEIIWTTVPVLILLVIAVPSFKLLFYMDHTATPEMTLKATGNMWYWKYDYPEHKIEFDSNIIPEADLKPGQMRLLEVDNQIIVPVNTNIRLLFTAADVVHSWAVPAFGVKKDCIPGRLNEAWINVNKEGTYYGQCSELCGMKHGFMPIAVKAVSKEEFKNWVNQKKTPAAAAPQQVAQKAK